MRPPLSSNGFGRVNGTLTGDLGLTCPVSAPNPIIVVPSIWVPNCRLQEMAPRPVRAGSGLALVVLAPACVKGFVQWTMS
jgi:hypothetical protein